MILTLQKKNHCTPACSRTEVSRVKEVVSSSMVSVYNSQIYIIYTKLQMHIGDFTGVNRYHSYSHCAIKTGFLNTVWRN